MFSLRPSVFSCSRQSVLALFFASIAALPGLAATPQASTPDAPVIVRIDPPQWWVNMPAALLLVNGDHLEGATFTVSDPSLAVRATHVSANGHWATLQLAASPAEAETVRIEAATAHGKTTATFAFDKRRAANDGMAGFSSKDVMYLIMTDRFADGDPDNDGANHQEERANARGWHGGDLRGVREHLDYLQGLGITTVWITPVYQNHGRSSYHGYGATDLYAVDEHFGSLADLRALADALHKRHMKLVLDTVPNHIGPAHPWVEDEPEPDWFHGTKADHHKAVGEFAPLVDPHAAWRDQRDILEGWFANTLPDMNQENPDAAKYLTQNAIWWVEQTGADGLRIDTFPYVGRPFWHDFHASLHALYPNFTSVGEVFNSDPVVTSSYATGVARHDLNGSVDTGLTTPFDFPTYFAMRDVLLHGKPMTQLAGVLGEDSLYPHPEQLVPFFSNHDVKRFLSEDGATPDKLKLAFAIVLTMRGMPELYSGDEIAMTGGDDPDNRHDFPGGFAGDAQSAFSPATRTAQQADMYNWVKQLLALRARYPELNAGDEQVLHADQSVLLQVRGARLAQGCEGTMGRMLVAVNDSDAPQTVSLETANTALAGCKAGPPILGTGSLQAGANDVQQITVPPGTTLMHWQ
ncbi:alpha-amylase [Acidipila sp. EB88]|nr:alpha-amylase [Acidipila sp. EB88]